MNLGGDSMETSNINPQARLVQDLKNLQKAPDTVTGVGGSGENDFMQHLSDLLEDNADLLEANKAVQEQADKRTADQNRGKLHSEIPIDQRL